MTSKQASRPAGAPRQYFQSPEAKSCAFRSKAGPWVFVLLYGVSLLFPSLLMQYLFSACAIQPDLHVTWSCSQWKITQFFGTGTGYWKVKKNKAIFDSQRKRKECAPEFETQADYVIQRNYGGRLLMVATCVELLFILRKKSICQLCGLSRRADFVLITNQDVTELSATGFYF